MREFESNHQLIVSQQLSLSAASVVRGKNPLQLVLRLKGLQVKVPLGRGSSQTSEAGGI
jgi:hypothetical protein